MADGATPVVVAQKRRNPYGEREMADIPVADAETAAERTQEMLFEAQKNLPPLPAPPSPEHGECFMCRAFDIIVMCEFCEQKACQMHTKLCHVCTGIFCALCSMIDYELRYSDASICLSCEEDHRKADLSIANKASRPHAVARRLKPHQEQGIPTMPVMQVILGSQAE